MVSRHSCQGRIDIRGDMTVLLLGVVVGVGTKRGFVGMSTIRSSDNE